MTGPISQQAEQKTGWYRQRPKHWPSSAVTGKLSMNSAVSSTRAGAFTGAGKPTSTPSEYQAVIENFVVEIESFGNEVQVRLRDATGKTIDQFSDSDLVQEFLDDPWKPTLLDFVSGLDRKASGADEALDEIIGKLDDDGVPF